MKKLQAKTYRLRNDIAPLCYLIKTGRTGNLLFFDEKKQVNRPIRHCPNEKSIFVDEQSEHAITKAVEFMKGYLHTNERDTITQHFLDTHPDNGRLFEQVDFENEAQEDIVVQDLVADLRLAVREKEKEKNGVFELEALVSVLTNNVSEASNMSPAELKREIYRHINANPQRFTNDKGDAQLFDEATKIRHLALTSIAKGVLEVSSTKKAVVWADTKDIIVNIPRGIIAIDCLSEHLETDEGLITLEEIAKRS